MITKTATEAFKGIETPFYYYDMELLSATADEFSKLLSKYNYTGHYAIKANGNKRILKTLASKGIGAECATGNEVKLAVECGFAPQDIVYAGVGKTDREIRTALEIGIYCFNCESLQEIEVINSIAGEMGKVASRAVRVNPDVDAHTHEYITTGREENKFGISPWEFENLLEVTGRCANINLCGLHFHIGSQITDLSVYKELCDKIDVIQCWFEDRGKSFENIDLGGGLGVDYGDPTGNPMPAFAELFEIIGANLKRRPGQKVHLEPGRSMVAQCGHLITRVVYVKHGRLKSFAILDSGMNNLIRPALYGALHKIENLTSDAPQKIYDIVGPVCESSDVWAKGYSVAEASRGDIFAIHSAGAYGEVMQMHYLQRPLAPSVYSDEL